MAIPQDIIDNIIEAVDDRRSLKECALVSSSFLLPCRKHLFSKLFLGYNRSRPSHWQSLHRFLVENPVIHSFVRSITIYDFSYDTFNCVWNNPSLIAILRLPFCCLQSFFIDNVGERMRWDNDFGTELLDTLSTIIHSSTLKTLYITGVYVPIMLFLGVNLTKLELTGLSLYDFDGAQSRLLTSEGAATTAFHSVVDHCVLKDIRPTYGTRFPTFA